MDQTQVFVETGRTQDRREWWVGVFHHFAIAGASFLHPELCDQPFEAGDGEGAYRSGIRETLTQHPRIQRKS